MVGAMAFPFMVFICLSTTFRGIFMESDPDPVIQELAKGVYLRKINLMADFQEHEVSVFENSKLPSRCFTKKALHHSGSNFEYYASTKSFYSKMATGAGLDASLQNTFTLGATLSSVTSNEESNEYKVSGMSLNIRALTQKILVKKDCLDDDDTSTLTDRFLEDFQTLPLSFEAPWIENSWKEYSRFFDSFGSHVIMAVKRGSSIKQTTFAESSKTYSQRDFQVKSCLSLAGPTNVGKVGVEACANVSQTERNSASNMNTADKLIVRGGTKGTRNALFKQRTEELIERLMNEADESDAAVEHSFRSIWDILQSRFKYGSNNYIRAVNLQYYYLGYLNYGCRLKESGGVQMQKFDYTKYSNPKSPEFSCTLAKEGCHSPNDCHYAVGPYCSCQGPSCVHYQTVKEDTGVSKETAYANTRHKWGWHGCDWKSRWFTCSCYNGDLKQRKEVWKLPSRDFVKKVGSGHHKFEVKGYDPDSSLQGSAEESGDQFISFRHSGNDEA